MNTRLGAPPDSAIDEPTVSPEQTRFLNRVLLAVAIAAVLLNLTVILSGRELGAFNHMMLAAVALAWAVSHRGHARAAVLIVLWSASAVILLNGYYVLGMRTPSLTGLPILLVLAALVLERSQVLVMAAAVLLALVCLTIADTFHWLPPHQERSTPTTAAIFSVLVGVSTALGILATHFFRRQYRAAVELADDLQRRLDALHSSEAHFSALFRASPIPCLIVQQQSRQIVDANDAFLATFKLDRDAAIGRTTKETGVWSDEKQRLKLSADIKSDMPQLAARQLDLGAPGEPPRPYLALPRRVLVNGMPCILSILLDQTDHLAAEAAQKALNADLEAEVNDRTAELARAIDTLRATRESLIHSEKLASLGALVASISHELNTPIGNAMVVATTLQSSIDEFSGQVAAGQLKRSALNSFLSSTQEMVPLILRSANSAAHLIASFKQVAIDQTSEHRREFDLKNLIEAIVATLLPSMKTRPWVVSVDVPAEIRCDSYPGPLSQVISNLVQNAALHGLKERERGNIRLQASQNEQSFSLSVSDDGKGMDADVLQRIFDPYFTTRQGQRGAGLGLATCRRIASTVLGGTLTATSVPGQGSRFTLTLPISAPGKM